MDRPVLHAFVRELVENERLAEFADSVPTRARVSESALPLLLASLHGASSGAGSSCSSRRTRTRATPPRAAAWFLGDDAVGACCRAAACRTSRDSRRHRISSASARERSRCSRARRGLVCASARALAGGTGAAPRRALLQSRCGRASSPASTRSPRSRSRSRATSARRARRRPRPVRRARQHRRRLPDHRPRTAAARRVLSATRSSRVRAFSPFTQRARSIPVCRGDGSIRPSNAALDLLEAGARNTRRRTKASRRRSPDDLVPPLERTRPTFVFEPDAVRRV